MKSMWNERKAMNAGLTVAAILIVIRILLEQIGAPFLVASVFGVVWLYFIMPAVFAVVIKNNGHARAFGRLMKNILLFAVYTRIMVAITYVAAHFMNWPAGRFAASQGGTVGPEVQSSQKLLLIITRNATIWIVMAAIIGMVVGSISLYVKGRRMKAAAC
jgi:hypothetical protein